MRRGFILRPRCCRVASSRRLAAIMFTDLVGFTQGTQLDERASLRRLAEEDELVRPVVQSHQGRVVKSTGDGLLVEFPSALQATECAVDVQERLRERNRRSDGPPIELRIGVHLGDVEDRGEDILGDAVNIAARVQTAAEAGGIAISQQVYDQVGNKLALAFERIPDQPLKGVRSSIPIFRIVYSGPPTSRSEGARPPEAGRLAVLPFSNISPDPKDAYFSDGLTEEVISTLSDLRDLRVIARTSVDQYRTTPRPVTQVGQELGVQWVLEGSVRRDGPRLRFTAQLIDVRTQEHLWSGRYDRELVDIFAIQSELAHQVAEALQLRLTAGTTTREAPRRAPSPESYLEYLQGRAALRDLTRESLLAAQGHFEGAIALDDSNAPAFAGLAETVSLLTAIYRTWSVREGSERVRQLAGRALELDPTLADAHTMLGSDLSDRYEYDAAVRELERAIALNPSFPGAHLYYGVILADLRRPEEALQQFALAEQLDPLSGLALNEEISLLTYLGRLDAARERLQRLDQLEKHGLLYHDRAGQLALATGDLDTYRQCVAWFEAQYPGQPNLLLARALLSIHSGETDRARELLAEAEALPDASRPDGMVPVVYLALGDLDGCFRGIDRAISVGRFSPRGWIYDAQRAPVRRDPRFAGVLRRLHLDRAGD